MNVIIHFPKTPEGNEELRKIIAKVHSEAVLHILQNLDCPMEDKKKILASLKKSNKDGDSS